jgi:mannosyltransferase
VEVAGRTVTKYGIALLVIVLAGAFLRVYHLGTQSLWLDEVVSVGFAKLSVPQMVQATARDVHPPLYYLILHYWIIIFGTSESAVRLLSALFGILAIPMIYVVGRQLFNKQAGLVAALILAISSFNIWYSQETRMYSLMVLLALLSMYFFWRFLQQSSLVSSVGYVLSTALLVWTHDYGWFVVIAQNIYVGTLLAISKHRTYRLRDWAVLQAIVVVLFVPWMAVLIAQILRHTATGGNLAAPTIADLIYTFSEYSGTPVLLVLFLGLSVLSLFAYQKVRGSMEWKAPLKALEGYAWEVRIQDAAPVYFLAVWLLAINLIPFIISRFSTPVYLYRYTIAASVALYILVAKGISNINPRYAKIAIMGIIVVLSVANLQVYYTSVTKPQAREATSFIDANLKSGDVVLLSPDGQSVVFDYYNNRTDAVVNPLHSWAVVGNFTNSSATPSGNLEDKINEIQSDVSGHDRIWFFAANFTAGKAGENFTLSILNESHVNMYTKTYAGGSPGSTSYGYDVYLFEKRT